MKYIMIKIYDSLGHRQYARDGNSEAINVALRVTHSHG